jgi:hypothetical protein
MGCLRLVREGIRGSCVDLRVREKRERG